MGTPGTAILWGGLACAVLDITAALVVYGRMGARPLRLLQGIAAGLLGTRAFGGGIATALVGLFCHFTVAYSAATVFVGMSRLWPILIERAIPAGAAYGVAVYFVMNHIVVPLSAVPKRTFSLKMVVIGILIHIPCVGLPIALVARRFLT